MNLRRRKWTRGFGFSTRRGLLLVALVPFLLAADCFVTRREVAPGSYVDAGMDAGVDG